MPNHNNSYTPPKKHIAAVTMIYEVLHLQTSVAETWNLEPGTWYLKLGTWNLEPGTMNHGP